TSFLLPNTDRAAQASPVFYYILLYSDEVWTAAWRPVADQGKINNKRENVSDPFIQHAVDLSLPGALHIPGMDQQ
ncbi:MAG: hypothetical protein WBO57_11015, partial [Gammaproteobacteria bacterium]